MSPEKFRPQNLTMQKEKSSYWSERELTTENFIWSHTNTKQIWKKQQQQVSS